MTKRELELELLKKIAYAQMQAERYQGNSQCIQLMLDNEVERLERELERLNGGNYV